MNILRASALRSARLATRSRQTAPLGRVYSTANHPHQAASSSSTPWFIGSILVFGPILFKLTSPPPKKKQVETHQVTQTASPQPEPVAAPEPVKVIKKPYVLIGAGTASFAAAQAIRENEPDANVRTPDNSAPMAYIITGPFLGYHHWQRILCALYEVISIGFVSHLY